MARRQIVWSSDAENQFKQILNYFISRNQSTRYSSRLLSLITDATHQISQTPEIGLHCENQSTRMLIFKDYLIYYEFTDSHLFILNIRDALQNPNDAPFERI